MRSVWVLAAAIVAFDLVQPARVLAQDANGVQRAIEVTQGVIDRASLSTGCTAGSSGQLECVYLSQAVALQGSARNSYAAGFNRDALATTLRARDRAYSSLRVAHDASRGEFVVFSIERTDALLDRIAPTVRASGQELALRQLDIALDLQANAKTLAASGRPRAALSATTQARNKSLRALRLADGSVNAHPDRAKAILDRTQDLLAESAWLAQAGASAAPYEKALRTQDRAWERFRALDPARAVDLSLRAREQLGQAFLKAERPVDRAAVETALRANAEALASLRGSMGSANPGDLERAEAHQRIAQEHFEAGRLAQALAALRQSQEIRARLRP